MRIYLFFLVLFCNANILGIDKTSSMIPIGDKVAIKWEVNYVYALEKARKEDKLLLVFFCSPPATDLYCENARSRFINTKNFLEDLAYNFVFCIVQPQEKNLKPKENNKSMHIQFLAKLISGGSSCEIKSPSFVIINPNDQKVTSGFISANLDEKILVTIFEKHSNDMINNSFIH